MKWHSIADYYENKDKLAVSLPPGRLGVVPVGEALFFERKIFGSKQTIYVADEMVLGDAARLPLAKKASVKDKHGREWQFDLPKIGLFRVHNDQGLYNVVAVVSGRVAVDGSTHDLANVSITVRSESLSERWDSSAESFYSMLSRQLTLGPNVSVADAKLIPNDSRLTLVAENRAAAPVLETNLGWPIYALSWRADGKMLAVGDASGAITVFDDSLHKILEVIGGHSRVNALAWSECGNYIFAGGLGGYKDGAIWADGIRQWDLDGTLVRQQLGNGQIKSIACAADRPLLSWTGERQDPCIVDTREWSMVENALGESLSRESALFRPSHVAWSPDGRYVAVAAQPKREVKESGYGIGIWSVEDRKYARILESHQKHIISLGWSPDSQSIISVCYEDQTAAVWDISTSQRKTLYKGHCGQKGATSQFMSPGLHDASWSKVEDLIATAGRGGDVRVWKPDSGGEVLRFLDTGWTHTLEFSPTAIQLAAGSESGALRVWHL